jgi:hypothetical protein
VTVCRVKSGAGKPREMEVAFDPESAPQKCVVISFIG